ncbi:MAG TPA: glycosyltransferase family 4 protein [Flavobacterium sp.]|jgi:glycosyltransferase involved in cell wall biosynthesis
MKILNVTTIPEWRGGDAQMYTVFNLLKSKKDIQQFILCPENSVLAQKCNIDKVSCYTYNRTSLKLIHATQKIIQICKKKSIDIIHVHDSSALNAALLSLLFLPKTIKIILSRKRNNAIKQKFLNIFKYSHPRIVKIVSVSKAVEAIFEHIIQDKERLITLYDAVDVEEFAQRKNHNLLHTEFNLDAETKIIGNIAALTAQKDIFTFIDTAEKIIHTNNNKLKLKFIVVGKGELKDILKNYILSKKLQKDILLIGYRNNVKELLPEFNVLLLTSITEGLPLTIYEAFASRIPVVATRAGGIAEVVINGKTGFTADVKGIDQLAEGVLTILNDSIVRENIKHNAYNLVKKNHDLNIMRENYYNFYTSL